LREFEKMREGREAAAGRAATKANTVRPLFTLSYNAQLTGPHSQNLKDLLTSLSSLSSSLSAISISSAASLDDRLSALTLVSNSLAAQLMTLEEGLAGVVAALRREMDEVGEQMKKSLNDVVTAVRPLDPLVNVVAQSCDATARNGLVDPRSEAGTVSFDFY
jgi:hypothetical protein